VSDTTETETPPSPKKKGKGPDDQPYNPPVTPTIVDQNLFDFLEELFYGDPEPEQFPEKITLDVVSGRYSNKIESTVDTYTFAPIRATTATVKAGAGAPKPSRERLVALSNKLLGKMRQDCDECGHARGYAINAWSTSRGDVPYKYFPKKMQPSGRFARKPGEGDADEDDGLTRDQKFAVQLYAQQQKMIELHGELMAGLFDRLDRAGERDRDENQRLRQENDRLRQERTRLVEQTERALSLELDREERREGLRQKRQLIDKSMAVVEQYGPMLAASLMGKKGGVINGSAEPNSEVEALQDFLRTTEDGGRMTVAQLTDAFGDWHDGELRTPGILDRSQALVIVMVARGQAPTDELDKLMPGGPLEIKPQQLMQLMNVFGDQLEPLQKVFISRSQKKKEK
jgi:hypothetical protein